MVSVDVRAQGDRNLEAKLRADPEIARAIERIEREGKATRFRRQLLAGALRLSPRSAPEVHDIVESCRARLGIAEAFELYVYADPRFNAACVRPEGGRFFVLFSSGLIESMTPSEIRFVVGHELGHHLFGHHRLPVQALLGGEAAIGGALALSLFAWSRYAEISADRAGLLCCGELRGAASTLFKLASGLHDGHGVRMDIDELMAQVGELTLEDAQEAAAGASQSPRADWFATHPFSPLRLSAARLFAESELMVAGGLPRDVLEARTDELMILMDPSYLLDTSDAAKEMRRLLLAGGVLVAAASGELSDEELAALEKLLGPGSLPARINVQAIEEDLPRRIEAVKADVPPLRRAQVIRDLCVIALADGHVDEAERRVLHRLAAALEVDGALVERTVGGARHID